MLYFYDTILSYSTFSLFFFFIKQSKILRIQNETLILKQKSHSCDILLKYKSFVDEPTHHL